MFKESRGSRLLTFAGLAVMAFTASSAADSWSPESARSQVNLDTAARLFVVGHSITVLDPLLALQLEIIRDQTLTPSRSIVRTLPADSLFALTAVPSLTSLAGVRFADVPFTLGSGDRERFERGGTPIYSPDGESP